MDIGSLDVAHFTADITAEKWLRQRENNRRGEDLKEAGPAAKIMAAGAVRIVKDLYHSGEFHGRFP